jgi:hypothetical protein
MEVRCATCRHFAPEANRCDTFAPLVVHTRPANRCARWDERRLGWAAWFWRVWQRRVG